MVERYVALAYDKGVMRSAKTCRSRCYGHSYRSAREKNPRPVTRLVFPLNGQ